MSTTSHSIEVNAPVQVVYYQWTRFEEFPYFMEAVEEVRRESDTRLFWRTRIGGIEKTWEAEITARIPGEKIAWKSVDGTENAGVITFEELVSNCVSKSNIFSFAAGELLPWSIRRVPLSDSNW